MSGTSVNGKMQKAFQRIGRKLGYKFKVYRSVDFLTPIQAKNFIGEQYVSFSLDPSFKTPVGSSYKQFNLFLDTNNMQLGDIFVSEEQNKKFVLVNKDSIVTPQAIETPHTITISRPGYSTVGSFESGLNEIAKDIPASIFEVGSAGLSAPVSEVKESSANHQYSIWVFLPKNNLKIDDIIEDQDGNKSRITSIEYSSVGYKLTARATK
jgi:phosphoribosyl-ATP pyrophosphohydrolase